MSSSQFPGYTGQILRVDVGSGESRSEPLAKKSLRKYVGGATLGINFLYEEVPPEVEWSDPQNRLFIGSGPLGGTRVGGSGAIAVVTKGALTQGMASSQANGFFGAFLRSSGFDGLILQGAAPKWVYVHIHDGVAEIRDAGHLVGRDTFEIDRMIKEELGKKGREMSVVSIGPAGETLVRFACISADQGHVAAHNGVGAVMGSKKVKAIAIDRGRKPIPLKDKEALSDLAKEILANTLSDKFFNEVNTEGTIGGVYRSAPRGFLPVKNYTTSVHSFTGEKLQTYSSQYIRPKFKAKPTPCWACSTRHCHMLEIPEGKYAGRIVEEPEFECMGSFSSNVGIDDVTTTIVLASEVDRLGMDVNESGYVISFLLECYEKGILTKKDTDGLEMTWGNGEAILAMLNRIANRQGIGDVMAEGVMRGAQRIGGDAPKMAVHTQKGTTVRSHDHRVRWLELFTTSVSNLGTLETSYIAPYDLLGLPDLYRRPKKEELFDPEVISTVEAGIKGAMIFEDSLVTCRFQTATALELLCRAVKAATGWDMDYREAMTVGRRAVNIARVFNLRHGIGPELDRPSVRYGSTPVDGVAAGIGIMPHWDKMLQNYYRRMGWDESGRPLPETLRQLGLEEKLEGLSLPPK